MITILTWLWRQKRATAMYSAWHVNRWAAMVRKHVTIPHRIACVTDMPQGIDPDIDIIPMPHDAVDVTTKAWSERLFLPQCYRRLSIFRPDAADVFGERFVSMDLDCVIIDSLDPLLSRTDDFICMARQADQNPKQYNGAMTMMTAGARPHVYTGFSVEAAEKASTAHIGSDQAWMTYALGPDETTWGEDDGIYVYRKRNRYKIYANKGEPLPGMRILFSAGRPKPWEMPSRFRWIREPWDRSRTA